MCATTLLVALATRLDAQSFSEIGIRGFGSVGNMTFTAADSFEAVLDRRGGPIFGGGGQVLLPWNVYVEIGAWRFRQEGERVFLGPNNEVFKLGIPVKITVTPVELTGGYRFRMISRAFTPYAGIGYSRYRYRETSEFASAEENVDDTFSGFHLQAGAEYQVWRYLAVGGEVGWSSLPDALGESGVSAQYREDNLGGTSLRLKITIGR